MLGASMGESLGLNLTENRWYGWAGKRKKLEILVLGAGGHWVLVEFSKNEFL